MEVDNLFTQQDLTEDKLLETLEKRYVNGQIYTNSGLFLISINPYSSIDLYSQPVMQMYKKGIEDLKPHVFSLLNSCIAESKVYGTHSILITGDSGSGKTETAKRMLEYLGINEIDQINIILESFGNAKTAKNTNSSRFGKLIRLDGTVIIDAILLERSRVTNSSTGENFHVFYSILSGRGISISNDYIECKFEPERLKDYTNLKDAAIKVGIDFTAVENIILGIVYLGCLKFQDGKITRFNEFDEMLKMLSLDGNKLEQALTRKVLLIGGEVIYKEYSQGESIMIRDSLARLLYSALFGYILSKINLFLESNPISVYSLNILDIFGFENFESNGLDQFCINWCNEKIYDGFVRESVEEQERIMEEEGIERNKERWKMPESNIKLIEGRCGIADLSSEEALLGGSAESLISKVKQFVYKNNKPELITGTDMPFDHFAGRVIYDLKDFIIKNRERCDLSRLYSMAVQNEDSPHCEFILEQIIPYAPRRSSVNLIQSFREDLESLFSFFSSSRLKYVRCFKPNNGCWPFVFDRAEISKQLRSSGVLQSVEISKGLYPYDMFIDEFDSRYSKIRDKINEKELVKGKTRYFYNNSTFKALETELDNYMKSIKETIKMFMMAVIAKINYKPEDKPVKKVAGGVIFTKDDITIEVNENDAIINVKEDEIKEGAVIEAKDEKTSEDESNKELTCKDEQSKKPTCRDEPCNKPKANSEIDCRSGTAKLSKCRNCEILEKKYKIQSLHLQRAQAIEAELSECKARLREYENSNSSSELENASIYNIFGCFAQLFIDFAPQFSSKDIPKDEMMSFAHGTLFILGLLGETAFVDNLLVFLDELNKRLSEFERSTSKVAFILSNLAELRICLSDRRNDLNSGSIFTDDLGIEQLDLLIETLFTHLCFLHRQSLEDLVPGAILEYQHVKEFKIRESIYKRIVGVPSVLKLITALEKVYSLNTYYYLPDVFIINSMSYLLSYIDFTTFNALLAKKKFLNLNRCIQINYNLSELEKFCLSISFSHGMYNMAYIREAVRVAFEIVHGEKSGNEIGEKSFLSPSQLNALISLFEGIKTERTGREALQSKFIDEPQIVVPGVEGLKSVLRFVHPKYLPEKSIKSMMKIIEDAK